jgi:hypothetical protein
VIRGAASVGYHSMQPYYRQTTRSTTAAFSGIASSIDLGYTLLGVTRFMAHFSRDANYSLYMNQPYYLSTAGGLQILQRLFGPVDLDVRELSRASTIRRRRPSLRISTPPKRSRVVCQFGCRVKRFSRCSMTTASGVRHVAANSNISAGAFTPRSPMDSDMKKLLTSVWTVVAMLVACIAAAQWSGTSSRSDAGQAAPPAQAIANRPSDYVVGAQDVLKITVFDEPTMSGSYRVDTDGSFQYPMLGRLAVGGMRIREVEQVLKTSWKTVTSSGHRLPWTSSSIGAGAFSSWVRCARPANIR